ncbi:MAG: pentapeptide repeat-containing protein [Desulfobacterales bacterium]
MKKAVRPAFPSLSTKFLCSVWLRKNGTGLLPVSSHDLLAHRKTGVLPVPLCQAKKEMLNRTDMMDIARITRHRIYRDLKTELKLSGINGIFSIVSPSPELTGAIIAYLKKDLPDIHAVSVSLSGTEGNFAEFFQTDPPGQAGKHLFHIQHMEEMSEKACEDFMGFLQTFPRDFPSGDCALLLWISPEFEDRLFFHSPHFCQRLSAACDLSSLTGDRETAGPAVRRKSQIIPAKKITQWLEKAIGQFENWQAVKNRKEAFLIAPMGDADFHSFCLPTCFSSKKGKIFLLDDLLRVFLENSSVNFMSLLGEPGSGKTAFLITWFITLARQFLKNPDQARIPVFLSLKDMDGLLDTEELLIRKFKADFDTELSRIKLQDLLLKGKCFFLVDGFDEMACAADFHTNRNNLERIAKLSFKNIILENGLEKPRPANKVLLTCTPHYFLTDIRETGMRKADSYTLLYRDYAGKENYQIVRPEPKNPDDASLKTYIVSSSGDSITARNLLGIVRDPHTLNRVSSPDLLKGMLIRTAFCFRDRKEVTIADIYRAFVSFWIERDDWRFRITRAGKREFAHNLAHAIFSRGNGFFLPASEADSPRAEWVKEECRDGEPVRFRDEIRFCEYITLDEQENFRFVHRSFLDYFLAEAYVAQVREGREPSVSHSHMEEDVKIFVRQIISSEKSDLRKMNLSGLELDQINLYQAELSDANLNKSRLKAAVLVNANLRGADLTSADLAEAKMTRICLRDAELSGANLSRARLREADLSEAKFNGANLRDADLRGAKLKKARLAWADLRGADLSETDLSGAVLTDADLTGSDLTRAILSEADLSGANLSRCILAGADLTSARISGADLSAADLSAANFRWADLSGTCLNLAKMEKAKFREADLTRAALDDAKCRHADFRMAKLRLAKFRDADLREIDFSGADLGKSRLSGADLTWANLGGASLEGADLCAAKLNMSKLKDVCLKEANLADADLTWADLGKADLSGADLTNANFSEADLSEARLVRAKLIRTNFRGASLRSADLRETDRGEAVLEDADMSDAVTA